MIGPTAPPGCREGERHSSYLIDRSFCANARNFPFFTERVDKYGRGIFYNHPPSKRGAVGVDYQGRRKENVWITWYAVAWDVLLMVDQNCPSEWWRCSNSTPRIRHKNYPDSALTCEIVLPCYSLLLHFRILILSYITSQ